MINADQARELAKDLVAAGDPNRPLMIMSNPASIGLLNVALVEYITLLEKTKCADLTVRMLREIQDDVQRAVMQSLQQEYPAR